MLTCGMVQTTAAQTGRGAWDRLRRPIPPTSPQNCLHIWSPSEDGTDSVRTVGAETGLPHRCVQLSSNSPTCSRGGIADTDRASTLDDLLADSRPVVGLQTESGRRSCRVRTRPPAVACLGARSRPIQSAIVSELERRHRLSRHCHYFGLGCWQSPRTMWSLLSLARRGPQSRMLDTFNILHRIGDLELIDKPRIFCTIVG